MTSGTRDTENLVGTVPASRLDWTRPVITRLAAGSAEDGGGSSPDSGVNPS